MSDDADAIIPPEVEADMALRSNRLSLSERTAPLVRLLRSGEEIPREVRELLADLLDQKGRGDFVIELKRRRRGRVTPIFPKNDDADLIAAEVETAARALAAKGAKAPKRTALADVAARRGMTPATAGRYIRASKQKRDQ